MFCEYQITQICGLVWPPVIVTSSESCSFSLKFCTQFINEATETQRPEGLSPWGARSVHSKPLLGPLPSLAASLKVWRWPQTRQLLAAAPAWCMIQRTLSESCRPQAPGKGLPKTRPGPWITAGCGDWLLPCAEENILSTGQASLGQAPGTCAGQAPAPGLPPGSHQRLACRQRDPQPGPVSREMPGLPSGASPICCSWWSKEEPRGCEGRSVSKLSCSSLFGLKVHLLPLCLWEGNRQEGQGSPNGGNRLQVPDIFISLKQQEETNWRYFFLLYTNLKGGFS